jgi:hypothetical protein
MSKNTCISLIAALTAGLLAVACGDPGQDESVESVQEALELENGGFDMTDEEPAFGLPDLDWASVDVADLAQIPEEPEAEQYTGMQTIPGGKQPALLCRHGFLKGVWKPFKTGKPFGKFRGKWVRADGKVDGFLAGVYGKNMAGERVFFGKYIDPEGKARGLLKGHWGNGYFRGRTHGVHGVNGQMAGVYAKGEFKGHWRAFCARCQPICRPGFKHIPGTCYCVPIAVVPCKKGQCPGGMFCDACPQPPACKLPGVKCPAVCGPPVCKRIPLP